MNTDKELIEAFDEGWKAYWNKKNQEDCPYYGDDQSSIELGDEWILGWLHAHNLDQQNL